MHRTLSTLAPILALALAACGDLSTPGIAPNPEVLPLPPVQEPFDDGHREPTRVVIAADEEVAPAQTGWNTPDALDRYEVRDPETVRPEARLGVPAEPEPRPYEAGALCTFDAEQWGARCADDPGSAACLRDAHFTEWYPHGLVVGRDLGRLVLTDAKAVERALPAGGPIAPMTTEQVDPDGWETNLLAAEIATLRLNLDLNRAGLSGEQSLELAVLQAGPLAGFAVVHVLEMAEGVLGGADYRMLGVDLGPAAFAHQISALNAAARDCAAPAVLARM